MRGGGIALLAASLAACAGPSDKTDEIDWHPMGPAGIESFVIPAGADLDALRSAAKDRCAARAFCKLLGFAGEAARARAMPMTDPEAAAVRFDYTVNRATGLEQAIAACDIPGAAQGECLPAH